MSAASAGNTQTLFLTIPLLNEYIHHLVHELALIVGNNKYVKSEHLALVCGIKNWEAFLIRPLSSTR